MGKRPGIRAYANRNLGRNTISRLRKVGHTAAMAQLGPKIAWFSLLARGPKMMTAARPQLGPQIVGLSG